MNKQKVEISVLVGLVVVGALVYFFNWNGASRVTGVSAAPKFVPLSVQEPQLRLDLLARLQKESTSTLHRNIFTATPPPPPQTPAQVAAERATRMVGPPLPPPPQPVHVPGEFFGYAFKPPPGKHFGFCLQCGPNVWKKAPMPCLSPMPRSLARRSRHRNWERC